MIQERKKDHVEVALGQDFAQFTDQRFYYEPMLSAHPDHKTLETSFLNYTLGAPLLISSMTGGWSDGKRINQILARAAASFRLPMGLGSVGCLLKDESFYPDFQLRSLLDNAPLLANLGIAQVEQYLEVSKSGKIIEMIKRLECDALIIHINPLQEWVQKEGDRLKQSPLETVKKFRELHPQLPLVIKEVGQGFGPKSLMALNELDLTAIDLAGAGGTNFTEIEAIRKNEENCLSLVGHNCQQMLSWINQMKGFKTPLILSGGIQTAIDAHYLISLSHRTSTMVGMAKVFLQWAMKGQQHLEQQLENWLSQLQAARCYLKLVTEKRSE